MRAPEDLVVRGLVRLRPGEVRDRDHRVPSGWPIPDGFREETDEEFAKRIGGIVDEP